MAAVRWTVGARKDLQAIVEFIASDSPTYAAATAERILASVQKLGRYPKIGRIVPEYKRPNLREVIVGNYRVVYRCQGSQIAIIAVVHGHRNILANAVAEKWVVD